MSNSGSSEGPNSGSDSTKIWGILGLIALVVVLAVSFVLSGSKRTINADDLRKGHHPVDGPADGKGDPRGDKVAFNAQDVIPQRSVEGSVVCDKDHTHGYPVCGTCKKIMQPLGNGMFVCPECGRIGLPICPVCGELMHSVAKP
ncbi:hypothetical protein WDW86_03485 [Bdellovibrionota bacterium FG-2]